MSITEKKQSPKVNPTSTFKKVIRKQEFTEEKSVTLRAEEPRVRYLKLQPFYRQSQANYGYKTVPELRLCGNWLEKAGFSPENYVSVTVMNGLLVIRSIATVDNGCNFRNIDWRSGTFSKMKNDKDKWEKCTAANRRFGVVVAATCPKGSGNFEVMFLVLSSEEAPSASSRHHVICKRAKALWTMK